MKKIIFLLMMGYLLSPGSAALTVTIGTGTSTSWYPLNDYYAYSRCQMLYLESENITYGTITHLRWYRSNTGSDPNAIGTTEIWLMQTSASTLSGNDWEGPGTLVASISNIDLGSDSGWYEIDISDYNFPGGYNLLVSVRTQNAPFVFPHAAWLGTLTSSYMTRAGNSDTGNPPAMNLTLNRPNIQLEITPFYLGPPNCANIVSPLDLATNVLPTATLDWSANYGYAPTGYKLFFGTDNPPTNLVNGTNLGLVTTFDPIPDMTGSMNHYWKIVPANTQGDATGCSVWSFTTGPDPTVISFPFCESINGNTFPPYGWIDVKTAGNSIPGIWDRQTTGTNPSCMPYSGAGMARFNSYFYAAGTASILVTPPVNFPTDNYLVQFWMYRDNGWTAYPDKVNVYYNTIPGLAGATQIGVVNRISSLPPVVPADGWYQYSYNVPTGTSGLGRIIFEGVSMYGNNMFIDEICIVPQNQQSDYGDAPDPAYPTLQANGGASHFITGLKLGSLVDGEPDGIPHPLAMGDDNNPVSADDEDGVVFLTPWIPGSGLGAAMNITASSTGMLNAWVDYNRDGDWADTGEHIFTDIGLGPGLNNIVQFIPVGVTPGPTFVRFRFNLNGGLNYSGPATEGEVEDYQVQIGVPPEGMQIDPDLGQSYVQNEISMALVPGTQPGVPAALLAAYNDHPYPGGPGLGVSYSHDGGVTWNPLQLPYPPDPFSGGYFLDAFDPAATADANGNLYVAHISTDYDWTNGPASGLYVHKSSDGGVTWTGPVAVATDAGAVSSPDPNFRFNDRCQMTADNNSLSPFLNNLYIVEIKDRGWNSPLPWGDIYFSRSVDGGATWSSQVILNGTQSNMANMPVPAVAPNGTIYVSWLDYNVQSGGAGIIYLDVSTDGGLTWRANDITVDTIMLPPLHLNNYSDVLAKGAPVIHVSPFNSQEVYLAYAASNMAIFDEADIYFIKSTDGGLTWSAPVNVNDNPLNDQVMPWMDVKPNGMIDIAWYDRRNDPADLIWDVYMTTSVNGGNSFSPNTKANKTSAPSPMTPSGSWMGEYPGLVCDQTHAYVAYTMGTPDTQGDIYFNKLQNPPVDLDFGDAPEGAVAYPPLGVLGSFPTCKTAGPAGWIEHLSSGAWLGPSADFETDGNAGLCPFFQNNFYDQDECSNDGDAGLVTPTPFTFIGSSSSLAIVTCTGVMPVALGNACSYASWGGNVDIMVNNQITPAATCYFNLLMDWNQDGQWGGTSTCPGGAAMPEHVLVNFPIPPNYTGPLSALNPPQFLMGPNSGYVWTRFSITDLQVPVPWDGSGSFTDGESEDYLLEELPGPPIPDSLLVQNVTVLSGGNNCYEAINKITVAGNGTYCVVQSGGVIHFIASQRIFLLPGTAGQSGSHLHAYITQNGLYCSNPLKSPEVPDVVSVSDEFTGSLEKITSFRVYPNPTTGALTLEPADDMQMSSTVIEVYGMLGEKILREVFSGQRKYEISLAKHPAGIYILHVITGKESGTVKIIRQ